MRHKICKHDIAPNVRNASGKVVPIVGTIDIIFQRKKSTEFVTFLFAYRLTTFVILGCDLYHRHWKAIKSRLPISQKDDGSMVPIVRQSWKSNTDVPLQEEKQFFTIENVICLSSKRLNTFV